MRPRLSTGVLILQNAKGLFLSQDLARANYRAESGEILHGTLLSYSTWVNRGVFWISIWGLKNGVPLGDPPRAKNFEKFFFDFFFYFLTEIGRWLSK